MILCDLCNLCLTGLPPPVCTWTSRCCDVTRGPPVLPYMRGAWSIALRASRRSCSAWCMACRCCAMWCCACSSTASCAWRSSIVVTLTSRGSHRIPYPSLHVKYSRPSNVPWWSPTCSSPPTQPQPPRTWPAHRQHMTSTWPAAHGQHMASPQSASHDERMASTWPAHGCPPVHRARHQPQSCLPPCTRQMQQPRCLCWQRRTAARCPLLWPAKAIRNGMWLFI